MRLKSRIQRHLRQTHAPRRPIFVFMAANWQWDKYQMHEWGVKASLGGLEFQENAWAENCSSFRRRHLPATYYIYTTCIYDQGGVAVKKTSGKEWRPNVWPGRIARTIRASDTVISNGDLCTTLTVVEPFVTPSAKDVPAQQRDQANVLREMRCHHAVQISRSPGAR